VASRTLTGSLSWPGSMPVADDLAEGITALKGRHDEVHLIGSLDLVQSLLRLGLVYRMNLWVYPVLLGSVFADGPCPRRCASPNRSPTRAARSTWHTRRPACPRRGASTPRSKSARQLIVSGVGGWSAGTATYGSCELG
jgi:hypothetical protein